jgi:Protein of unknown function (DUF2442)
LDACANESSWKKIGDEIGHSFRLRRLQVLMPMSDLPMVDVLRLRPLEGYRLWLRFTDGSEGVHDLSDLIAKGGKMVEPLKSKPYFDRVFVEMGAPTWPNGFDLDPINLYMQLREAGALSSVAAE